MEKLYNIQKPYKLVLDGLGDRSCHWRKDALCVYRDTLMVAVKIHFHPFIPLLLADVRVNPYQLPPNVWRLILYFIVLCVKISFSLSVAVFRKKFQFRNSLDKNLGWVTRNQRPTIPHIVNGLSIPDNNLK